MGRIVFIVFAFVVSVVSGCSCETMPPADGGFDAHFCPDNGDREPSVVCDDSRENELMCMGTCGFRCVEGCWLALCDGPCGGLDAAP